MFQVHVSTDLCLASILSSLFPRLPQQHKGSETQSLQESYAKASEPQGFWFSKEDEHPFLPIHTPSGRFLKQWTCLEKSHRLTNWILCGNRTISNNWAMFLGLHSEVEGSDFQDMGNPLLLCIWVLLPRQLQGPAGLLSSFAEVVQ